MFLCENGGVIYKDEQCIAKNPMPRALAEEIANDLWTRSDGHAYNLCNSTTEFRVLRVGGSIRVPKDSFDAWLYRAA